MTKRHIGINKNNKDVLYGVHARSRSDHYWAKQGEKEIIDYTFELKDWLDTGETISAVTETSTSLAVSKTVNTTSVYYQIAGIGSLEIQIATTNGNNKTIILDIVDPQGAIHCDYVPCGGSYGW